MTPEIVAGMTAAEAQTAGSSFLRSADIADPATDARVLIAHVFGVSRDTVRSIYDDPLSQSVADAYRGALLKRAQRSPVSHITGEREFYGRVFKVGPAVLDPRPETELLVDVALEQSFQTVLDLGTGSGCILYTLLLERPGTSGMGVEVSALAWKIAAENRDALELSGQVMLRQGIWFAPVDASHPNKTALFDLIVSNPPYIAASEMDGLQPEVRDHEPRVALTDGLDGLESYRAICASVMDHLKPGGRLIVEIGPTQGVAVCGFFEKAGLQNIEIRNDLGGRNRVVLGSRAQ